MRIGYFLAALLRRCVAFLTSERLMGIGYFLAALLHRYVAFLIRSTGRLAGKLLARFPWSCKLGFLCVILGGTAFHLGDLGETLYIR